MRCLRTHTFGRKTVWPYHVPHEGVEGTESHPPVAGRVQKLAGSRFPFACIRPVADDVGREPRLRAKWETLPDRRGTGSVRTRDAALPANARCWDR